MDYRVGDENPHVGVSYYRIKQTDYDGNSETFHPVSVNIKPERKKVVKVYNQMGQEISIETKGVVFLIWDNGDVTKTFNH